MNKKQMLKEQKRLKLERRQTESLFNDDKEVYNIFKIILAVILFIGLSFVVINIAKGTWNVKNKEETKIDSNMVMVGTMFNKEEGEYLVLAYDMSDESSTYYTALASRYSGSLKLYYLDLSSGFNRDYLAENAEFTSDSSKIKFSGPTLLLINKDIITKSYVTEEETGNYLNNK